MSDDKKYKMDMCHGSLFRQIFQFSLPLIATNIMILMFHAADLIVLGQFAPAEVRTAATAAVGATAALSILLLVFFFGFGAGVNSITARYIGAKDYKKVSRTVHTSIALGVASGLIVAVLGVLCSRPVLVWMDTPEDVLDKATLYLQICSIGLPFTVLYTIGSSILRAVGDTKRPLIYIAIAGVVNVLLNLFFVLVCKMDAAGVALATKISNILSAFLVLHTLHKSSGAIRLLFKHIRFHWAELKEVLWIGIPAGIQGALYCVSNVFIQSAVNTLGSSAMAGNAACQSLEGVATVANGAYYQSSMSFTGQNLGGKKYKRVIRSIFICLLYTTVFSLVSCGIFLMFGKPLLGFYNPDPKVIEWGMQRFGIMMCTYFLGAIMDAISGSLRGLGHSVKPTITTVFGTCVFRIFWVMAVFPNPDNLTQLMVSYPISWLLISVINGIILFWVCRKMLKQARDEGMLYLQTHGHAA
ncbi:MAG: MATE family efflux transporter [Lentisphaerae bacterium]|nr:MATE family efflux transporter [Lentisphaerota bacterium]